MPLIRALTLTVPECSEVKSRVNLLRKLADRISKEGVKVWSLRISVNWPCPGLPEIAKVNNDLLISVFTGKLGNVSVKELIKLLMLENMYASAVVSSHEEVRKGVGILKLIGRELGPDALSRFGYLISKPLLTPYFPLSSPLDYGVTVALRYADLLASADSSQWTDLLSRYLRGVEELVKESSRDMGIPYLGIDASLSPWMSESVVPIINKVLNNAEFPYPGSAWGVSYVNKAIADAIRSSGIKAVGFNELMLPVAEDDTLKELTLRGRLRLRDLIWLSSHCVAGVDMVAVPPHDSLLEGVIHDLIETSILKGRHVGIRLIIADDSCRLVRLRLFGELPVINP